MRVCLFVFFFLLFYLSLLRREIQSVQLQVLRKRRVLNTVEVAVGITARTDHNPTKNKKPFLKKKKQKIKNKKKKKKKKKKPEQDNLTLTPTPWL
jgi:hypothetical protein